MRLTHQTGLCGTLILAGSLLVVPNASRANLVNGSFESGLNGWSSLGDVSTVTSAIGVTPPEGSLQAFLTTSSRIGDSHNFSGIDAALAADLATFLGVAAADLGASYEGSALSQTFTITESGLLSFRYNFLTTEGGANDFAVVILNGVITQLAAGADATNPSLVELDPIFGDPASETGYQNLSLVLPTAGTYTLAFAVFDANDEFIPSALLVDDVRATFNGNVIPEPSTVLLAGLGGVILLASRRRTLSASS